MAQWLARDRDFAHSIAALAERLICEGTPAFDDDATKDVGFALEAVCEVLGIAVPLPEFAGVSMEYLLELGAQASWVHDLVSPRPPIPIPQMRRGFPVIGHVTLEELAGVGLEEYEARLDALQPAQAISLATLVEWARAAREPRD